MTAEQDRLEYLRGELRAERLSYGDLAELQELVPHIDPGDVELLEAAGVPEHMECPECGGDIQATTKYHWTLEDRVWSMVNPSAENEISIYCENDHELPVELIRFIEGSLRAEVEKIDGLVEMGS